MRTGPSAAAPDRTCSATHSTEGSDMIQPAPTWFPRFKSLPRQETGFTPEGSLLPGKAATPGSAVATSQAGRATLAGAEPRRPSVNVR
jgi:hypothetical protein